MVSAVLYHGGASGFRPGDVIQPHETKKLDDCPVCAAGDDANHLPDRVFATPSRLYAKHYASEWGRGWLYIVEPLGDCERSEPDSIETYHASELKVVKVSERGVELTRSERRRLYRLWEDADGVAGIAQSPTDHIRGLRLRTALGMRL